MNDTKFSEKLISQITIYFQKHYDLTISPEQAEEYLDSLTDLYLAFYHIELDKKNNK